MEKGNHDTLSDWWYDESLFSLIENREFQIRLRIQKRDQSQLKTRQGTDDVRFGEHRNLFVIMCAVFQIMYTPGRIPDNAIEDALPILQEPFMAGCRISGGPICPQKASYPVFAGVLVFIPQILCSLELMAFWKKRVIYDQVVYPSRSTCWPGLNQRTIDHRIRSGELRHPYHHEHTGIYNPKNDSVSMFVIPLILAPARIPVYCHQWWICRQPKKSIRVFFNCRTRFIGLYFVGIFVVARGCVGASSRHSFRKKIILIMQLPITSYHHGVRYSNRLCSK